MTMKMPWEWPSKKSNESGTMEKNHAKEEEDVWRMPKEGDKGWRMAASITKKGYMIGFNWGT